MEYRSSVLLVFCTLFIACSRSDDDIGEVTINFNHTIDGTELVREDLLYTNAAGNVYSLSRLEYIISDIALETAGGKRTHISPFHYRNAFSESTRNTTARVAGGEYTRLLFTFGINGTRNQTSSLPNLDHFNNMAWPAPMGGGYHYMRMEGLFQGDEGEAAFLTHTGPAGGEDYSFDVSLPLSLYIAGESLEVEVIMNLNEWYDSPTIYDFNNRGGIMSNAEAQLILQTNGATVFSVAQTDRQNLNILDHGVAKIHLRAADHRAENHNRNWDNWDR